MRNFENYDTFLNLKICIKIENFKQFFKLKLKNSNFGKILIKFEHNYE